MKPKVYLARPTISWDIDVDFKDDIVEEIHNRRETYAAQFQNDLDRIFEDLKSKEQDNPAKRVDAMPLKRHERLQQDL